MERKKANWDHVQNRSVGTGNPDTTKKEWASNQMRDTIASNIGHPDMLAYISVAQSDSMGRVRYELLEKMLTPTGQPKR
jgi:splicing factor 3B subunit 5